MSEEIRNIIEKIQNGGVYDLHGLEMVKAYCESELVRFQDSNRFFPEHKENNDLGIAESEFLLNLINNLIETFPRS